MLTTPLRGASDRRTACWKMSVLVGRNEEDHPIRQPDPMRHDRDCNGWRLRQHEGAGEGDAGTNRAKVVIFGRGAGAIPGRGVDGEALGAPPAKTGTRSSRWT
jgi:hypothetical protein